MTYTEDMGTSSRIRELRLDRGYTRDQLAELAGISSKFLYEIEVKEKGFSAQTLKNLSDALEVSADFILTGEGNKKYDADIAATIELFEPNRLKKVAQLLRDVYELSKQL